MIISQRKALKRLIRKAIEIFSDVFRKKILNDSRSNDFSRYSSAESD
jgi:hypothetical protein